MERTLEEILLLHGGAYPAMESADFYKLVYQNEFGCGHMAPDPGAAEALLAEEYAELLAEKPADLSGPRAEDIGNGLCRVHLDASPASARLLPSLGLLFAATAGAHGGGAPVFKEKLGRLRTLAESGLLPVGPDALDGALLSFEAAGWPSARHSVAFRRAYRPHYRVVRSAYMPFLRVFEAVRRLSADGRRATVAIDGGCGSGKTLLAELLEEVFDCAVFHMDDFFLPSGMRTEERLKEPGGNMDRERFMDEVLRPLACGREVRYRPYDCAEDSLGPTVRVPAGGLGVVEGSYSAHPYLSGLYDLRVFLTCSREVRLERLAERESPESFKRFIGEWIPLEERYFAATGAAGRAELVVDTSEPFFKESVRAL